MNSRIEPVPEPERLVRHISHRALRAASISSGSLIDGAGSLRGIGGPGGRGILNGVGLAPRPTLVLTLRGI